MEEFLNMNAWPTVDALFTDIANTFEDKGLGHKAHVLLENLRQGRGQEIDDYFTRFDELATESGNATNTHQLWYLLKKNLHPKLVEAVVLAPSAPDNYADFRTKIIEAGRRYEQYRLLQKTDQARYYLSRKHDEPRKTTTTTTHVEEKKTGTGLPLEGWGS